MVDGAFDFFCDEYGHFSQYEASGLFLNRWAVTKTLCHCLTESLKGIVVSRAVFVCLSTESLSPVYFFCYLGHWHLVAYTTPVDGFA